MYPILPYTTPFRSSVTADNTRQPSWPLNRPAQPMRDLRTQPHQHKTADQGGAKVAAQIKQACTAAKQQSLSHHRRTRGETAEQTDDQQGAPTQKPDERRVGNESAHKWKYRWSPEP